MATSTITAPFSYAQTFGTLGHAYLFAAERIALRLQDSKVLSSLGIISLRGDVAGLGTDTLRVTDFGGVGFALPMTELASETDTVAPSPASIGYEEVTIGQFGLAFQETYKGQVLANEQVKMSISLDALKARTPDSWEATFRAKVCEVGAAFTTAVGAAGTTLSVDDALDLATAYDVNLGNTTPHAFVDGTQINQLKRSFRSEPAFQNSAADFAKMLGITDGTQTYMNLGGLGVDYHVTNDIEQSGGARQGFAFPAGGIGWAVANTLPIRPANPAGAIYVPAFGLFIEEIPTGGNQTIRMARATALFGVAAGSDRVYTKRRIISVV